MTNQARRETAGLFSFFKKRNILHIINKKEIIRRIFIITKFECLTMTEYQEKKSAGLLTDGTLYMICYQSKVDEDEEIPAFSEVYDAGGNRVR